MQLTNRNKFSCKLDTMAATSLIPLFVSLALLSKTALDLTQWGKGGKGATAREGNKPNQKQLKKWDTSGWKDQQVNRDLYH